MNLAGTAFCLTLATAVLLATPLRDRQHDRVAHGQVGQPVGSKSLRVEVTAVRLTRTAISDGERSTSPGVFVVVELTAEALRQPADLEAEVVTDDRDRTYAPTARITGRPIVGTLTPGFRQRGALVFELPADAIPGAALRIRDHTTLKLPVYLEVPLGMDADEVAAQLARTEPLPLPDRVDPAQVDRRYR